MNTRRQVGTSIWPVRDKVVTRAVYQLEIVRDATRSSERVKIDVDVDG